MTIFHSPDRSCLVGIMGGILISNVYALTIPLHYLGATFLGALLGVVLFYLMWNFLLRRIS